MVYISEKCGYLPAIKFEVATTSSLHLELPWAEINIPNQSIFPSLHQHSWPVSQFFCLTVSLSKWKLLIFIINFHWGRHSSQCYFCQQSWHFLKGFQELHIFNKREASLMLMKEKTLLQTSSKNIIAPLKIFSKHLGIELGGFFSCNLKSISHSN